jgi:hypothetical protein
MALISRAEIWRTRVAGMAPKSAAVMNAIGVAPGPQPDSCSRQHHQPHRGGRDLRPERLGGRPGQLPQHADPALERHRMEAGQPEPAGGLDAVATISATNAWAVGNTHPSRDVYKIVILHWNGTAWNRR